VVAWWDYFCWGLSLSFRVSIVLSDRLWLSPVSTRWMNLFRASRWDHLWWFRWSPFVLLPSQGWKFSWPHSNFALHNFLTPLKYVWPPIIILTRPQIGTIGLTLRLETSFVTPHGRRFCKPIKDPFEAWLVLLRTDWDTDCFRSAGVEVSSMSFGLKVLGRRIWHFSMCYIQLLWQ